MQSLEEYMQFLKVAASGERPHTMLPGRTSTSKRSAQGTVLPERAIPAVEKAKEPEESVPVSVPAVVVPDTSGGAPKVDIKFSVKVGEDQTDPDSQNTQTRVDGSFHPTGRVGGGYPESNLAESASLMRTPVLPGGPHDVSGVVGDVRTAADLQQVVAAKSDVQRPVQENKTEDSYREGQELQRLLEEVKREGTTASTVEKIGMVLLRRKMAEEEKKQPEEALNPAEQDPEIKAVDHQRKQDVHEQQLQFSGDKHELELEKLRQQLQHAQEKHELQMQVAQQKAVAQQNETQATEAPPVDPQAQALQQQLQYQQNIMAKAAAFYTDEMDRVDTSSSIPAMAVGTGLGGLAAHYISPTEEAKKYREMVSAITPEDIARKVKAPVSDITQAGNRVRFTAPAHVRKSYFANRAVQANAKRLLQGSGLGLLAGLAAYHGMKE